MRRRTSGGRRGWRQWTEHEARSALDELAASGDSAAQFARRKGFSTQRLAYWRKRLACAGRPAFVSVALPLAASAGAARAHLEVVSGAVTVRVREDVEAERLAVIVEVLARRLAAC